MNNLQTIIAIAAGLSLPVSAWAILYFLGRIISHYRIRSQLGDMPSAEEIRQLYDRNNAIIQYKHTPPL
jgi:hypothetical protein